MKRYYLAYGSNLNLSQMALRCPGARRVGTGTIRNFELLFKGSKTGAYLTIEKKDGAHVPVGIFTVTPDDEERLDHYEGYPAFYYKTEVPIKVTGGRHKGITVPAFIYIMHEDRKLGIPSSRYVETCMVGYDDFGFDKALLQDAVKCSWEACGWEAI
jgi:hypothetical protein